MKPLCNRRLVPLRAGSAFVVCTVLKCLPLILIAGCNKQTAKTQLVLTGSSTVAPLAAEIGRRFETRHPGERVNVQTGGSSRGIADARRGLADIGMVSRDLTVQEHDLRAHPIARDGICVILHKSNSVESLTDSQIRRIYTGRVSNWREVGGPDAEIVIVNKAEGRSTLELFLKYFKLKNTEIQATVVVGDNEQGIKTVAGSPHAIGYVSIGTAEYDAENGVAVKLLPLNGVAATVENVRNGSYPLARTLNLITAVRPQGLTGEFIEFARSPDVKDIIEEQYFVALNG